MFEPCMTTVSLCCLHSACV